ncbi:exonuclease III [Pseudoalteromonas sp. T1lg65]|uniref:exonuclease III n=1 Tax=Pseudoalteromonas sp. T1lg65 TaxID=2077101 RepID=UPI003F797F0A
MHKNAWFSYLQSKSDNYNAPRIVHLGYIMLKSLTLLGMLSVASSNVFASQVEYVSKDASVETKVCTIAAEQGFEAARKHASSVGLFISRFSPSVKCNGTDIREFAKLSSREIKEEKKVSLFAKNDDRATELCLEAVRTGLKGRRIGNQRVDNLRCNNMPVQQFVKEFKNAAI